MIYLIDLILIIIYYQFIGNFVDAGSVEVGSLAITNVFIPLIGIPLIVHFLANYFEKDKAFKEMLKRLKKEKFVPSNQIRMVDSGILIDSDSQRVCFIEINMLEKPAKYQYKLASFNDVLSSEILIDEEKFVSASSSSMVGRALVGGLLFSGVGAIIGGVTAKTSENSKVKKLELKVVINTDIKPVNRILFYNGSTSYAKASQNIELWQVLFEMIMIGEEISKTSTMEDLKDRIELIRLREKKKESIPEITETVSSDDDKKCPFCAETIKKEAIVCRYCNNDLSASKT